MSYYCDKYPIIEKKSISRDTFSITIYAPEAAKAAHAGQFANISAPGFTLRRPISICEFSRSRGTLRFVFEVRGKGTEAISRLNVGDNLDVLGPLGNGFAIPDSARRAVLVGGGTGEPPMLGLQRSSATALPLSWASATTAALSSPMSSRSTARLPRYAPTTAP